MMAAASALSTLSSELSSTAASYESVISQLTGSEWQGPSSTAMASAAQPYIGWLNTTSGQLQQAASQAIASAGAYEMAFAATVPPPVIAANRATLMALIATNFLGINTPAIMATEAHYMEMWAQDAAAMYGYAGASAAAAQLSPLTPPANNTNPGGAGLQAAAVGNAVNSNASSSGLNGLLGNLQNGLASLANPAASTAAANPMMDLYNAVQGFFGVPEVTNTINSADVTLAWCMMMFTATMPLLGHFAAAAPFGVAVSDVTPVAGAALGGGTLVSAVESAGAAGFGGAPVLAGLGSASSVGGLSVPASWAAATPATAEATLAGTGWTAAAETESTAMSTVPAGVGMPAMASAGRGGLGFGAPRYGFKPTIMPKQVFV